MKPTHKEALRKAWDVLGKHGKEAGFGMPYVAHASSWLSLYERSRIHEEPCPRGCEWGDSHWHYTQLMGVPCAERVATLRDSERQICVSGLLVPEAARHAYMFAGERHPHGLEQSHAPFEKGPYYEVPYVRWRGAWLPSDLGWAAFALEEGEPGRVEGHHMPATLLVDVNEGGRRVRFAFNYGIGYTAEASGSNRGHRMTGPELREFDRMLERAVPITA